MSRPAASKQDDYTVSRNIKGIYVWQGFVQERTLQPALHLDSQCHGDIPNMSKKKRICGGFGKRIEGLTFRHRASSI